MLKRWIAYIITLFGAIAFYGIYEGYISYFLLIVIILFPLFSLSISLFGMLRMCVSFMPIQYEIKRGDEVKAIIHIEPNCLFPLSQLTITYNAENITFNSKKSQSVIKINSCTNLDVLVTLDTNHVGYIYLNVTKIKAYDYLGLFFVSLQLPEKRHIAIWPNLVRPKPMPILPMDQVGGRGMKPKPGGGFAEEYDLREYRIGDPLNSIHWKLTSKLDEIIVKEPLISEKGNIFICFNLFGTADELDNVFGQISYVSHIMIRRRIEFNLCWYGQEGNLNIVKINDKTDLLHCIVTAFSNPIIITGNAIDNNVYKKADWHYFVRPNLQTREGNEQ